MRDISIASSPRDAAVCPIFELCEDMPRPYRELEARYEWSRCSFVSVSQLVTAAVAGKSMAGQGAKVDLGEPAAKVMGYAQRMDFFRYSGMDVPERFSRHPEDGRFVPLHRVSSQEDVEIVAHALVDLITNHLGVDESVPDALNLAFGEILDNVLQHADSPFGGAAGAQWFPTMGFIELCVADGGRGIAASMARNPDYGDLSEDELVLKAFELNAGRVRSECRLG